MLWPGLGRWEIDSGCGSLGPKLRTSVGPPQGRSWPSTGAAARGRESVRVVLKGRLASKSNVLSPLAQSAEGRNGASSTEQKAVGRVREVEGSEWRRRLAR